MTTWRVTLHLDSEPFKKVYYLTSRSRSGALSQAAKLAARSKLEVVTVEIEDYS